MAPLTMEAIEKRAYEAVDRRDDAPLEPWAREGLARRWVRAFYARWSTLRHLGDLDTIAIDITALAQREQSRQESIAIRGSTAASSAPCGTLSLAEEEFLRWLRSEKVRHDNAIAADEGRLATLECEAGVDFIRTAIQDAEMLGGMRIQVEGGSPLPKEHP